MSATEKMMKAFPSFVAFRAPCDRYFLAYVTEGQRRGFLEMSAEVEVLSPKAKFVVERANDDLVHTRCCYNNKYLRSASPDSLIEIAPATSEPVINKSAWNCTLFKLQSYSRSFCLYHVRSKTSVHVYPFDSFLKVFTLVDIESLVKLPKRVTFKGKNGKYLRVHWQNGKAYNQFSGKDASQKVAQYEIFYTWNGHIRVKSVETGMFWRCSPNWICCDYDDYTTTMNLDTLFDVVKIGDNVIALRNHHNKYFCQGLTKEWKRNCLNAGASSIVPEARLVVEEPVSSREIDVQFRLQDARIYNKRLIQAGFVTVPNTTDRDHEIQQGFTYTKSKTGTWSSTTTLNIGCKASIKAKIPFIVNGAIEVSGELSEALQFGKSKSFSQQLNSTYKVPVPLKTKAIVKLLATEAKYDIPFSYIQKDQYSTREIVTTTLEDSVYHGIDAYDFYYEPKYEKL